MNDLLTSLDWHTVWPALVEILLLFAVLYAILRFLQGTRGAGVLHGLVFFIIMALVLILFVINKLPLYRIQLLINAFWVVLLPIIILFQPEIRRLLLRFGEAPLMRLLLRPQAPLLRGIVDGVFTLSSRKIGALITIEREVGLGEYIERGTPLNASVTAELLVTIFWPGSPLHDGAVIIRGNRLAAAGCLLPLTDQPGIAKTLGTRHRAAIGITEHSDALSIVVSEETQQVSVAHRGQLQKGLDRDQLRSILEEILMEAVSGVTPEAGR